jgi:hypothetical protein
MFRGSFPVPLGAFSLFLIMFRAPSRAFGAFPLSKKEVDGFKVDGLLLQKRGFLRLVLRRRLSVVGFMVAVRV